MCSLHGVVQLRKIHSGLMKWHPRAVTSSDRSRFEKERDVYVESEVDSSNVQFSSVQFSRSIVSDSLRSHELQHARPPCPSSTPGVHPNPCPLYRWCHPTISSSVIPLSSHPQSFPESGSFVSSSHQVAKVLEFQCSLMFTISYLL